MNDHIFIKNYIKITVLGHKMLLKCDKRILVYYPRKRLQN